MKSMILATPQTLQQASDYLIRYDPTLGRIIKNAGPCTIRQHHEYYRALGDSIIGQQLSVQAAASIERRFRGLFGGSFPSPQAILEQPVEFLRTAGLSRAKATYLHDLARHIVEGKVNLSKLDQLSNEKIMAELTDIKGVGTWTVHMFLIFCMGRLDILPVGDLGIRNGIRTLYRLEDIPTPQQVNEVAEQHNWHPYESVASWYIWHSLDNKPAA